MDNAFRRIFITGASSGLGEGLALHFAKPGATLGLVARRADVLDGVAARARERGAVVHVYALDVADTEGMHTAADHFLAQASAVDLVIANAGIGIRHGLLEGESSDVARLFQVNVIGVTNTVIPFLPAMVANGSGVVVAMGSFAGHRPIPGASAYCASKAAVKAFMDGLRMDLHGTGVHAMTLCPGYVRTPMTAHNKKMMFAIDVQEAVASMVRGIEARADHITIPWQMNLMKHVVVRLPEVALRKLAPKARSRDQT